MTNIERINYLSCLLAKIDDVRVVASYMARDHRYLQNEWMKIFHSFIIVFDIRKPSLWKYDDYDMVHRWANVESVYRSEYHDNMMCEMADKYHREATSLPEIDVKNDRDVARKLSDFVNSCCPSMEIGAMMTKTEPTTREIFLDLCIWYTRFLAYHRSENWYDGRNEWACNLSIEWMPEGSVHRMDAACEDYEHHYYM